MTAESTRGKNKLRDALALTIVQKQRDLEQQLEVCIKRAETAEQKLVILKQTILQFRPSPDDTVQALIEDLPDLEVLAVSAGALSDCEPFEEIRDHQTSLTLFLRNVHALRTAQMLKGKQESEIWFLSTVKLVTEFATTSLLKLRSGKLRTAYVSHVVDFFQWTVKDRWTSQADLLEEIGIVIETAVQSIRNNDFMTDGKLKNEMDQSAAMELLIKMLELPLTQSTILRKTTAAMFSIVRHEAQKAGTLRLQQNCANLEALVDTFASEHVPAQYAMQELCLIQERCLEEILSALRHVSESALISSSVLEELVKTTVHSQQYVEILEIFCPKLAAMIYSSTALIIAFIEHISCIRNNDASVGADFLAQQQKCTQLSNSVQDFYMPRCWNIELKEP